MLVTVYDKGPVAGFQWESFDEVRARVRREWAAAPKTGDNVAPELRAAAKSVSARLHASVAATKKA